MIDERMMIEYPPIRPEGYGREREHEMPGEVEELVDRRGIGRADGEHARTSGTSRVPLRR